MPDHRVERLRSSFLGHKVIVESSGRRRAYFPVTDFEFPAAHEDYTAMASLLLERVVQIFGGTPLGLTPKFDSEKKEVESTSETNDTVADNLQTVSNTPCIVPSEKNALDSVLPDPPRWQEGNVSLPFDVLVSIADRGGGALTHEVARLSGDIPYVLANWYPDGTPGEICIGRCAGFNSTGQVWLNGLKPKQRCLVIRDTLDDGNTTGSLVSGCIDAGCSVVGCAVPAELVELKGRTHNLLAGVNIVSLLKVSLADEWSKELGQATAIPASVMQAAASAAVASGESFMRSGRRKVSAALAAKTRTSISQPMRELTEAEERDLERIAAMGFYEVPITRNGELNSYPYSFFQLTDFVPAMRPSIVEAMAELMVKRGAFQDCDIILSEADRGGGPLAVAVARRVGLPMTMANWYPFADGTGATTAVSVGYSGEGQIVVNGVTAGDRCIFVDDMVSSGGTAAGVLSSAQKLGGEIRQCIFASEKLYPTENPSDVPIRKGKRALLKLFPGLDIVVLTQFVADGDKTAPPRASNNE